MSRHRARVILAALTLAASASLAEAQTPDPNAYPTPYHEVPNWAKLPSGRNFGQVIGVYPAFDGTHIWVFERCGNRYCNDSSIAPIDEFDASGKLVKSFGAGLFVFPHGLSLDRKGNLWVTDADIKDGKGNQVWKLSPTGKVLMTLGKKGVAGSGPDEFDKPCDVAVAKDGSSSPTARTTGCKSSTRTASSSPNGASSASRAASISTGMTRCMSRIRSRTPRPIPAPAAASASAAPRPARSRPSSPIPIRRTPAAGSAPAASPKASPPTPPAMSMAARRRRRR